MTKCSVYIAISLDGFISRTDGGIDWLNDFNARIPKGEDLGYARFMSSVDALVMGRNTFEQVLAFGMWPYGSTPVVVLSRRIKSLPEDVPDTVSLSADEPGKLVKRLSARGWHHLYVDGGLTIQSFIKAGLIDEITITVIPILLGNGKSLFGPLPADVELELVESKAFDFGFVQSKYRIVKSS
jgi:dihydrofolate reductase